MSLPLLLNETGRLKMEQFIQYGDVFYGLCVALNIMFTGLISTRLFMMRHKAERVLGRLQASLYNSTITIFVESGAFFTLWVMTYLILRTRNSWVQDVFQQPYTYVLVSRSRCIDIHHTSDGREFPFHSRTLFRP